MSPWSAITRRELLRKYLPFAAILAVGLVLRIQHLIDLRALPVFDHVTGADVSEYWNRALAYAAGTGDAALIALVDALYDYAAAAHAYTRGN